MTTNTLFTTINTALDLAIIGLLIGQRSAKRRPQRLPSGAVLLDSCCLIDGRLEQVIEQGFLTDEIGIPSFVLSELQLLADTSKDAHKRARARAGLDLAERLLRHATVPTRLIEMKIEGAEKVDDKLLALARQLHAKLATTDYTLQKVAQAQGIVVLNVNQLALELKPHILPGKTLEVTISKRGTGRDQGMGYTEEGIMVVVANGAKYIGKVVTVRIEKAHQTAAGRMVFGSIVTTK